MKKCVICNEGEEKGIKYMCNDCLKIKHFITYSTNFETYIEEKEIYVLIRLLSKLRWIPIWSTVKFPSIKLILTIIKKIISFKIRRTYYYLTNRLKYRSSRKVSGTKFNNVLKEALKVTRPDNYLS